MYGMFGGAEAFNQPLAFDTVKVTDVRVYCVKSNLMRHHILIPYSNPTFYQMGHMFYHAAAFNQPLDFNTAKVENVRRDLCVDSNEEKPESNSLLQLNFLSDEIHVWRRSGLQPTT